MALAIGFTRREGQVLGLVGSAHMLSHLYMLSLAPLLPLITRDLNISYTEFGIALAVFAIVTGVFQTPMGLLVERVGGRAVLMSGLFLNAICFVLIGFVASDFWQFVFLMALAGLGNSVFHPADYSLLSSSIGDERMGRAFSVHTFIGHLGFIAGPIVTAALEPFMGWRWAVVTIGALGLVTTLALFLFANLINDGTKVGKKRPITESLGELLSSPAVLLFFVFYMFSSAANVGLTQFSVVSLQKMYGLEQVAAVVALTAYQVGALILVLPGGVLADKTTRYDLVMIVGFAATAVLIFIAGIGTLPFWMVVVLLCVAGALRGGVNTSRDVAVRRISGGIPVGTVFGFVSTGFLVGQAVGGPFYGWLFDNYPANYIFYVSAAVHVLAIGTVMFNPGTRHAAAPSDA